MGWRRAPGGLKSSGVDPPLCSSRACLHPAFTAFSVHSKLRIPIGPDQGEPAYPVHHMVLETTSRNQGSELSSATMIPQMTVVADLTRIPPHLTPFQAPHSVFVSPSSLASVRALPCFPLHHRPSIGPAHPEHRVRRGTKGSGLLSTMGSTRTGNTTVSSAQCSGARPCSNASCGGCSTVGVRGLTAATRNAKGQCKEKWRTRRYKTVQNGGWRPTAGQPVGFMQRHEVRPLPIPTLVVVSTLQTSMTECEALPAPAWEGHQGTELVSRGTTVQLSRCRGTGNGNS